MVLKLLSHVQLFVTPQTAASRLLCPWGFSQQEYWSGLPCPPPGDLPNPGIESRSLELQADSLPSELPRKPDKAINVLQVLPMHTSCERYYLLLQQAAELGTMIRTSTLVCLRGTET